MEGSSPSFFFEFRLSASVHDAARAHIPFGTTHAESLRILFLDENAESGIVFHGLHLLFRFFIAAILALESKHASSYLLKGDPVS